MTHPGIGLFTAAATATAATLIGASSALNSYIDHTPRPSRRDGETALYTAVGVTYTNAAACLFVSFVTKDWRAGAKAFGLLTAAYAVAGLPMFLGDVRRSARSRKERRAADAAFYAALHTRHSPHHHGHRRIRTKLPGATDDHAQVR